MATCGVVVFAAMAHAQFGAGGFSFSPGGPYGTPARLSSVVYQSATNILAASPEGGLWITANGGGAWIALTDSAPSSQICTVVYNGNALFAGTGDDLSLRANPGVMRSLDGGQTWSLSAGFSTYAVCALAVDPANAQALLAGSLSGIFRSIDQGATWTQVSTQPAQALVFDPAGNGVVYACFSSPAFLTSSSASTSPLMKSTDGGVTWNVVPITPPFPQFSGEARTFARANIALGAAGTLYLAVAYLETKSVGSVDVFVSNDNGNTWNVTQGAIALSPNVAGTGRLPMFFDAARGNLYIGGATLQVSTAAAQTFSAVTYPPVGNVQAISANLTLSPPALLVAGDLGLATIPLPTGTAAAVSNPPVSLLESSGFDPVTAQNEFVSGESGLSMYSAFFGTWTTPISTPVGFTSAVATNPEDIFALAGNGTLYESTNAGVKFSSFTAIPSTESHAPYPPLMGDPLLLTTLYTAGQRFYRSTNGGQTWSALSTTIDPKGVVTALAMSPLLRQVMYAATACLGTTVPPESTCPATSRVYMSTNTGTTWTLMATVSGYVSRLAVDPGVVTAVYATIGAFPGGPNPAAGLEGGDVLVIRSTGTTSTQTSVKGNLPSVPINAILVKGNSGPIITTTLAQTYFVGADTGIYATTNGGITWINLSIGLPPSPVTDLVLSGTTLHVSTYGRGVYTADISQISASLVASPLSVSVTVQQGQTASVPLTIGNLGTTGISYQVQLNNSWLSTTTPSGTLGAGSSQNITISVNSASLAPGSYRTTFQVIQNAGGTNAFPFSQNIALTVKVTSPPANLVAVSGGGATVNAGSQVTLVAETLDASNAPLGGASVQFAIVSGGGQLSSASVTTNSQGLASVTLTLPSQAATVNVSASSGSLSVAYTVTAVVLPAPTLNAGAVVNAATFVAGASLAPGSIVSLFGTQLANGLTNAGSLPLPTTLGGTQVLINGTAMPLFYVSLTQINALLPFSTAAGTNQISVNYPGPNGAIASNAVTINVTPAAPGIFADPSGAGIFLKSNNTVVSAANPAARGSFVTFYATGLGAVSPAVPDGAAAPAAPLSTAVVTPSVNIGGVDASVQFAGLAPGFAGLFQINAFVPASIPPDTSTPVTLRVGLLVSNTVTLPVN